MSSSEIIAMLQRRFEDACERVETLSDTPGVSPANVTVAIAKRQEANDALEQAKRVHLANKGK
ncbi:MAG: hypothetical protein AB7L09_22085 [Nitrospira sp.]